MKCRRRDERGVHQLKKNRQVPLSGRWWPCTEGKEGHRTCYCNYYRKGRKYNIAPSTNTVRVTTSKIRRFCFGCLVIDASALLGATFGLRADWTSMVRLTRRPRSDNVSSPNFTIATCWLNTEGAKPSTSHLTRLTITRPKTNRSRKHVKATSHLASIATTSMAKRSSTKLGC